MGIARFHRSREVDDSQLDGGAVKQQSVAVGVNIKPLQLYGGGIVRMHDCPPADINPLLAINHAAVLVGWGYDKDSNQPYWILKNLVTTPIGARDGHAKLSMELGENGYGTCGLYTEQNYPLTDGRSCAEGSSEKWSVKRGNDIYLEPDDVLILPNGKVWSRRSSLKFSASTSRRRSNSPPWFVSRCVSSSCSSRRTFCMFQSSIPTTKPRRTGVAASGQITPNAQEGSYGAQT